MGGDSFQVVNPAVVGGVLSLGLFVGILLSLAFGRALGERAIAHRGADGAPSLGSIEGAVFALLGLLIAFTFSGALERFDGRRAQVVDEANVIGTAWLRLDLLPASAQPALREAFRAYVDSRLETYRLLPDLQAAQRALARSQALQSTIWAGAVAGAKHADARPAAEILLLPALNAMFDITTVRVAATQRHPPVIVFAMLFGLALVAALLAGYQSASAPAYGRVHRIGFAAIVALTVYVILDIEYPRLGFVRIDAIDQLLVNVRANMK